MPSTRADRGLAVAIAIDRGGRGAMTMPPGAVMASTTPRGFSIWPGLFAGLGVTFALAGLELSRSIPVGQAPMVGGVMVIAHGTVAFAVITLLGQALAVATIERSLVDRRSALARRGRADDWLANPADLLALRDEVGRASRGLAESRRESMGIGLAVVYVVPLVGFATTTGLVATPWAPGPGGPWSVAGRPLLVNLAESLFVFLLLKGVAHASEVVEAGWRSLGPGGPSS